MCCHFMLRTYTGTATRTMCCCPNRSLLLCRSPLQGFPWEGKLAWPVAFSDCGGLRQALPRRSEFLSVKLPIMFTKQLFRFCCGFGYSCRCSVGPFVLASLGSRAIQRWPVVYEPESKLAVVLEHIYKQIYSCSSRCGLAA